MASLGFKLSYLKSSSVDTPFGTSSILTATNLLSLILAATAYLLNGYRSESSAEPLAIANYLVAISLTTGMMENHTDL